MRSRLTISVEEEVLLRLCAAGSIAFREVIERLDLGRERANALRMRMRRMRLEASNPGTKITKTVTFPTTTATINHTQNIDVQ